MPVPAGGQRGVAGMAATLKHRNIKQKFIALLRKFKLNEEALVAHEAGGSVAGSTQATSRELQALFEELDNLSDSGGELDNMSQVRLCV